MIIAPARSGLPAPTARPEYVIRRAGPADREPLLGMLARCSAQTRLQRFHGFLRSFPEPYFTQALHQSPGHLALVAELSPELVALASYVAEPDGTAQLAVLVQDAHQRLGLGTRLVTLLAEHAGAAGAGTLRATVLADQAWIVAALRRLGRTSATMSYGILDVTVRREAGHG